MRTKDVVGIVSGAITVYMVIAACGSGGANTGTRTNGDAGDPGDDVDSSMLDALLSPMPEAMAAPDTYAPSVDVEACDHATASGLAYAEHLYPGKSIQDLSSIRVIVHETTVARPLPGYENFIGVPYVADGRVAVSCGLASGPSADNVTFILP